VAPRLRGGLPRRRRLAAHARALGGELHEQARLARRQLDDAVFVAAARP
jgi:hypothetical protein